MEQKQAEFVDFDASGFDVIYRNGEYVMACTGAFGLPAVEIFRSADLEHWSLVNRLDGIGAKAVRFVPDAEKPEMILTVPEEGIYSVGLPAPEESFSLPVRLKQAVGRRECCAVADADGQMNLLSSFVRDLAGFGTFLYLEKQEAQGDGSFVFRGGSDLSGVQIVEKNGLYYIFAAVMHNGRFGQIVLRGNSLKGPFEEKTVLETDDSEAIQGIVVQSGSGECRYLLHTGQDSSDRVIVSRKLTWENGWPVIGGETEFTLKIVEPECWDCEKTPAIPFSWQWSKAPQPDWYSFADGLLMYPQAKKAGVGPAGPGYVLTHRQLLPGDALAVEVDYRNLPEYDAFGLLCTGDVACGLFVLRWGEDFVLQLRKGGETERISDTCAELDETFLEGSDGRDSFRWETMLNPCRVKKKIVLVIGRDKCGRIRFGFGPDETECHWLKQSWEPVGKNNGSSRIGMTCFFSERGIMAGYAKITSVRRLDRFCNCIP